MTKYEIVEELGRGKEVEKIAKHFNTFAREDLCQYVYLYLLEKVDEDRLIELYETGKLKQYISGVIYHQIISNHSHYFKTYRQCGYSIENCPQDDEIPWYAKLVYKDAGKQHQLEDEVDAYISTLSAEEQGLVWILLVPLSERTEDIKIWCNTFGYTYKMYQDKLFELKNKIKIEHNIPITKRKYEKTKAPKNARVKVTDKDGNETIYANRIECIKIMREQGLCSDCIYKCLAGKRNSYHGYFFEFID